MREIRCNVDAREAGGREEKECGAMRECKKSAECGRGAGRADWTWSMVFANRDRSRSFEVARGCVPRSTVRPMSLDERDRNRSGRAEVGRGLGLCEGVVVCVCRRVGSNEESRTAGCDEGEGEAWRCVGCAGDKEAKRARTGRKRYESERSLKAEGRGVWKEGWRGRVRAVWRRKRAIRRSKSAQAREQATVECVEGSR